MSYTYKDFISEDVFQLLRDDNSLVLEELFSYINNSFKIIKLDSPTSYVPEWYNQIVEALSYKLSGKNPAELFSDFFQRFKTYSEIGIYQIGVLYLSNGESQYIVRCSEPKMLLLDNGIKVKIEDLSTLNAHFGKKLLNIPFNLIKELTFKRDNMVYSMRVVDEQICLTKTIYKVQHV